ncbi:response regulator [Bdellovibrio sp. HCB209]|uniref:response regulator n=1 Tax=Bdellovibrio sp. HCB209 TaxID=3394354 RepID=UPI0039B49847
MDTKNILIAEDSEIEGMILERALKSAGYNVERASDGLEALEKYLSKNKYDLLITDISMPGLSGIELIWHAREKNILPPTIVLTSNRSEEASLKSLEIGALDHLTKPYNLPLILAKVKVALGRT